MVIFSEIFILCEYKQFAKSKTQYNYPFWQYVTSGLSIWNILPLRQEATSQWSEGEVSPFIIVTWREGRGFWFKELFSEIQIDIALSNIFSNIAVTLCGKEAYVNVPILFPG